MTVPHQDIGDSCGVSPTATEAEVVEKIVHLRRHYHFGPAKIAMYLARYHDVTINVSGVWRILTRLGLNRLPASQRYQRHDRRWKRYEKAQPRHRVQIDDRGDTTPSRRLRLEMRTYPGASCRGRPAAPSARALFEPLSHARRPRCSPRV